MKKPDKLYSPAFRVYQTITLKNKRALDNIIDKACADLKSAALSGYLTEPHLWMQHAAFKLADNESGFGKLGPFRRPKAALFEPIFHIHILPVSYIFNKHQHHATSNACIVYADFTVHNKRIILMLDFGSSHNGDMSEKDVWKYIDDFHKLRPGIIDAVKTLIETHETPGRQTKPYPAG
ncbi:type II toxin-antitoxin system YafO family toxin [Erwinia phyllosphaerae]|uniref:type II toxin-antitoxin system YafO family toxin n=1 Tax=Erwinia phyllosphaerae TaxID=2853256 RepID=UPI001FED6D4C|nr:type II toxin-antitoxin system YafO family toxin [Erwinia phyllosphaerae]MBV4367665.1 type II toxin-antitoxin system YafO family toxin [Erwinia phyllosphaerae]